MNDTRSGDRTMNKGSSQTSVEVAQHIIRRLKEQGKEISFGSLIFRIVELGLASIHDPASFGSAPLFDDDIELNEYQAPDLNRPQYGTELPLLDKYHLAEQMEDFANGKPVPAFSEPLPSLRPHHEHRIEEYLQHILDPNNISERQLKQADLQLLCFPPKELLCRDSAFPSFINPTQTYLGSIFKYRYDLNYLAPNFSQSVHRISTIIQLVNTTLHAAPIPSTKKGSNI